MSTYVVLKCCVCVCLVATFYKDGFHKKNYILHNVSLSVGIRPQFHVDIVC